MTRKIVVANWKMNCSLSLIEKFLPVLSTCVLPRVETIICPPLPYLCLMNELSSSSDFCLGGQDCASEASGAFTGEVAPKMLKEVGCSHVIIGHSERRKYQGETDEILGAKVKNALNAGLTPIYCVGETMEERQAGLTETVVGSQIDALFLFNEIVEKMQRLGLIIAYEPVWAIGTGESATPQQAEVVHAIIKTRVARHSRSVAERVRVLYGGSVNTDNALDLFGTKHIDGGLIGGASLDAEIFNIIRELAAVAE